MYQSQWQAKEGVAKHNGSPITADMDFFAAPSLEIGKIITADTTLKKTQKDRPLSSVLMLSLLTASVAGAAGQGALIYFQLERDLFWQIMLALGVISIAALLIGLLRFVHFCTYVGSRGVIEYKLSGSRDKITSRLFLFKNAEDLLANVTRRYHKGRYIGTTYNYRWKKAKADVFTFKGAYTEDTSQIKPLKGIYTATSSYYGKEEKVDISVFKHTYNQEKGQIKPLTRWQFACAAESAWSNYRRQSMQQQLDKLGYVEFSTGIKNPKYVRVGSGFMEFVQSDNSVQRLAVMEMKDMTLNNGLFKFVRQDANWWSGNGKYAFYYGKLPNVQLFVFYLAQLTGICWS